MNGEQTLLYTCKIYECPIILTRKASEHYSSSKKCSLKPQRDSPCPPEEGADSVGGSGNPGVAGGV